MDGWTNGSGNAIVVGSSRYDTMILVGILRPGIIVIILHQGRSARKGKEHPRSPPPSVGKSNPSEHAAERSTVLSSLPGGAMNRERQPQEAHILAPRSQEHPYDPSSTANVTSSTVGLATLLPVGARPVTMRVLMRWTLRVILFVMASAMFSVVFSEMTLPTQSYLSVGINETMRIINPDASATSDFRVVLPETRRRTNDVVGIEIYVSVGCPPLTGPPIVTTPLDYKLHKLGYQALGFQTFRMNRGSNITLDVQQYSGWTEFYILKGPEALNRLQDYRRRPSDRQTNHPVNFRTNSSPGFADIIVYGSYTYSVPSSHTGDDIYTVVYSNPNKTMPSSFSLKIVRSESNFAVAAKNLYQVLTSQSSPSSARSNACMWDKTKLRETPKACIIVKGVECQKYNSTATRDGVAESIYFITRTTPDLMSALVRSGVPFLVIPMLFCLWWCCCSSAENHQAMHGRIASTRRRQQPPCEIAPVAYPVETTTFLSREEISVSTFCPCCGVLCADEQELQSHMSQSHRDVRTTASTAVAQFPCGFCRTLGRTQLFWNEQALLDHTEQEHGLRYDNPIPIAEGVVVQTNTTVAYYGSIVDTGVVAMGEHDESIPLAQSSVIKEDEFASL